MLEHIIIEAVTPSVDGGRYPAKRNTGEPCVVEADIFRDGHELISAVVKWRRKQDEWFLESSMAAFDNERWGGEFPLADNARYVFTIEAWTDRFGSWLSDFRKKVDAGREVASDLLEGLALVEAVQKKSESQERKRIASVLQTLKN